MKKIWAKKKPSSKGLSKYKNASCKCLKGHIHDSILEAGHCNIIQKLYKGTEIKTQKRFDFVVNGQKICSHIVDFYIPDKNIVIESKGFPTDVWKIKQKLFIALYPEIEYIVWSYQNRMEYAK